MRPMNGWAQTEAQMGASEHKALTPGGHIVRIRHAECQTSKSGREMVVLYFDVDEGSEFDGMFQRQFDGRQKSGQRGAVKWPNGGTYYQLTEDENGNPNPRFKGLIQAITESNMNFLWDWNEAKLAGKYVGLIFREEEYLNRNNEKRIAIKAIACCPTNEAKDKPAPAKKLLDEAGQQTASMTAAGFTQSSVTDDELPF